MSKWNTIKKILKKPKKIIRILGDKKMFNWLNDKSYLKLLFYCEMGYKLDLKNPKTFNEKLQWLKLNDRKEFYNILVDKYNVREYISNTIGNEYLIPLIDVYYSVEEINWDVLPNSFVIKCTHGSGSNIICKDKRSLDIKQAKKRLKKWMKKNWYWFGREWVYKDLKPKIIIEKHMALNQKYLEDYKVLCFGGKAKLIQVHLDRYDNHTQDYYDINFNKTEISQGNSSNKIIEKPKVFDEMIKLSEKLSKDLAHARIDWYIVDNKLYFGEITFFDGSGLWPFDDFNDDLMIGSWIDLNKVNNSYNNE